MMREFVCPRCGLVLEASAVDDVVWMGEHVAACVVPTRARFTAIGNLDDAKDAMAQWFTSHREACNTPGILKHDPPLAFTWAETLSVADAEFLHGLGIDPL